MRGVFLLIILCSFCSCNENSNPGNNDATGTKNDTLLVKQENDLTRDALNYRSKSFTYHWITGKDTSEFKIYVSEWKSDSAVNIALSNRTPILFTTALNRVNECISLIKGDFDLSKIVSVYFEIPLYYPDLAKELSREYEQKFGKKNISYQKLNEFLLESTLNARLNDFFNPFGKKVHRYSIEKFHLLEKEHYKFYLPDTDFSDYPEFTIFGAGISARLTSK